MTTPTTPERAREIADEMYFADEHEWPIKASRCIKALAAQVEALTAYNATRTDELAASVAQCAALAIDRNLWRQKCNASDLMAECTVMLRDDLIEAGIVSASVPAMMLTEAVMAHVSKMTTERDAALKMAADAQQDTSAMQAAAWPPVPQSDTTDAEILALAHRKATTYAHRSDPSYHSYAFVPHSMIDFGRSLLAAQKAKS